MKPVKAVILREESRPASPWNGQSSRRRIRAVSGAITPDELLAALVDVREEYEPGELAYLALTSKSELGIRDRLAWILTRQGRRVGREWRARCDLAVLDESGEPYVVLESKAAYGHDTTWHWKDKHHKIRASIGATTPLDAELRGDAEKALRVVGSGDGYLLVTLMHRLDAVPRAKRELISEAHRPLVDPAVAEANILRYLAPLGPVSDAVDLAEGDIEGIRVIVRSWLCGPVQRLETWRTSPTELGATKVL
jgi:hypothetical protein